MLILVNLLQSPLPLYELAMIALDTAEAGWTEADGSKDELAQAVRDLLASQAALLDDYFSMEIDADGSLSSIPLLLGGFIYLCFKVEIHLLLES